MRSRTPAVTVFALGPLGRVDTVVIVEEHWVEPLPQPWELQMIQMPTLLYILPSVLKIDSDMLNNFWA